MKVDLECYRKELIECWRVDCIVEIVEKLSIPGNILQILDKCGYDFIYKENDYETISDRYTDKYGYKTKQTNRNAMISMFKQVFNQNYRFINDYETLCEMENFQVVRNETTKKEKALATGDNHDDLVMAMAGCFYIRNEQSFHVKNMNNVHFYGAYSYDPFNTVHKQMQKNKNKVEGRYLIRW